MSQSITVKVPYATTCGIGGDWITWAILGGAGLAALVVVSAFARRGEQ